MEVCLWFMPYFALEGGLNVGFMLSKGLVYGLIKGFKVAFKGESKVKP